MRSNKKEKLNKYENFDKGELKEKTPFEFFLLSNGIFNINSKIQ